MTLPSWPPRDWRAVIALAASIAGAMALTAFSAWIIRTLAQYGRAYPETRLEVVHALANSNYGLLGIIGAILLSLGLAINRRTIKGNFGSAGFEASGGDDDPAARALNAASDALGDKATEIEGGRQ